MKKSTAAALILAAAALILDSRCAADAAGSSLILCGKTLIPTLFPLFVVSGMLVPGLQNFRLPWLSRLMRMPPGAEGIWLLGAAGGFPVGAASVAQAVQNGSLSRKDGKRMLGLCSLCGPAFIFGILPQFLSITEAFVIFVIQLETSLLIAAFWNGTSCQPISHENESVSLPQAVRRAVDSILTVCAWVVLAGVATGFLRKWLFPILPGSVGILLTGLLELTTGIFALPSENRFLLTALFICFGGVSVLLQIGGLAGASGLSMGTCIGQKAIHGLLGTLTAGLYLQLGYTALLLIPALIFAKIMVEIPGRLLYNSRERKGSECCFVRRWSGPASIAATAQK